LSPSIKQVEAFFWTARLGSFQAAATRLHTTQSAISKRVGELEHIFETQVFNRHSGRARLTHDGERLLPVAEELLRANSKLVAAMSGTAKFNGVLRLGTSELVGLTWLPRLVQRLRADHPEVVINLDILAGDQVIEKLRKGMIDLAIVAGASWGRQFEAVRLASVKFSWMASPSLKAPRHIMTPQEMTAYPMLVHSPDGLAMRAIAIWQEQNGFNIHRSISTNALSVVGQLTMDGLGVSCLPVDYFSQALRERKLVRLRTDPALPSLDFFAVYRRDTSFPLLEHVMELSRALCDFRHPSQFD